MTDFEQFLIKYISLFESKETAKNDIEVGFITEARTILKKTMNREDDQNADSNPPLRDY